jgi:hypothetical protein
MSAVWKRAGLLAMSGCLVGILIGVAVCLLESAEITPAVIFSGGLYGALAMGSSVIYEIEEWSIARSTVTHFLLILAGYTGAGLLAGWFTLESAFYRISIAVVTAAYAVIWFVRYYSYKRRIRAMNDELKEWRKARRPK